jgi:hypothetical protein
MFELTGLFGHAIALQHNLSEDGSAMNQSPLLGLFVATISWIPVRNVPSAVRSEVRNYKTPSRTAPTELFIPLH